MRARRFLIPGWGWWALILIAGILAVQPLRAAVEQGLSAVSRPIVGLGQSLSRQVHLTSTRTLEQERDDLRHQVAALTSRLAEAQQKLEVSSAISQLTAYVTKADGRTIVAGVVAYSPDPGIESLVISRGTADGVRPGMAVIADQRLLIGKIQTVHQRTATVLLLTDSQATVAARIQNDQQSPGIVGGERGLAIVMNFIPKSDEVKVGQTVVTSGTETLIPPDIVIGTIRDTSSQAGELFRRATIISPIQLGRVRVVSVINIQP